MLPLILLFVSCVSCANILFISPLPSPSHHIWNYALAAGLNEKGHNVTFFDPDALKKKPTDLFHPVEFKCLKFEDDITDITNFGTLDSLNYFFEFMVTLSKDMYASESLRAILENKESYKFDAVILDITIMSCTTAITYEFPNIPIIGVTPFMLPPELSHIFGNSLHPAYIPHYLMTESDNMSFFQRLNNLLLTYTSEYYYYSYKPIFEEQAKKRFGSDLDLSKQARRVSILLSNMNPIFDYPQPVPPNIIPVGGLHAKPAKKLPQDLQSILDNAKNGVIVFSLGTNVKSNMLKPAVRKILIDAFRELKQIVIWKFESDLPDLPKNVIIRKWLPQNDIIAHPNVRLFIGHGGALSTQEAFYHGVPIVGVPFFFDQHINVKTLTDRKKGLKIDIRTMTTKSVVDTISEALNNPIYRNNVQDTSRRFKDLPMTPLQSAVFWVEYALKHNGTSFLDTRARDMTFLQYTCLDVVLFLLGSVLISIIVIFYIVKAILKLVFKTKSKKKRD